MPTSLWRSVNYKTPMKYLLNTYIREYDLSKANISSLLYTGRITQKEHSEYLNLPKQVRERNIGLWIRKDRSVFKDIQSGILEAKRRLVTANDIQDAEVVSVKNDAMFIQGRPLQIIKFDPFEFKLKNVYTMYLQLQDLEVYYGDNVNISTGMIDVNICVKGIPDEKLYLHEHGMLDIICDTCYKLQREDIVQTMTWISGVYDRFVNRKLYNEYPLCYKEFNSDSMYTINLIGGPIMLGEIGNDMVECVDINRNLLILRDLVWIVSSVYHAKR